MSKIKVFVVDDSALVRKVLADWIQDQPDMEVVGVAADPYVAVDKLKHCKPDVITLDIEMPRMDGLTFLRKLMSQHPIPVMVVSSLAFEGSDVSMKALEYGAVDIFLKDDIRVVGHDNDSMNLLMEKIRGVSRARVQRYAGRDASRKQGVLLSSVMTSEKIILLGASTGGTNAIKDIVSSMPANSPGMVIVQHMPKGFTRAFAERLNEQSVLTVKEAEDGETVTPGKVLIAPGDKHVKVFRKGAAVFVRIWDGPRVNLHKPSVDVLFQSGAAALGVNAIGVLLTGMGKDGAEGLLALRQQGALTIAQDEASCVVYGMPREAVRIDAAAQVSSLQEIPAQLIRQSFRQEGI